MKKRWVALMTAVCLVVAPMSVVAEETDYSYLEDLSVKELRELDAEIHKLLGDSENITSSEEIQSNSEELSEEEEFAVELIYRYVKHLKNPRSFKLYSIYTYIEPDGSRYEASFDISGTNSYGAEMESMYWSTILVEDGENVIDVMDHYDELSTLTGSDLLFMESSEIHDAGKTKLDEEKISNAVMEKLG